MDLSQILTQIGNFGFPIVMCLMMYNRYDKTIAKNTENIAKNTEATGKMIAFLDTLLMRDKNE